MPLEHKDNSFHPDDSLVFPPCSHLVPHSPKRGVLSFLIYCATWDVFFDSNMLLMFHETILAVVCGGKSNQVQ